jgi:hypothetical protein
VHGTSFLILVRPVEVDSKFRHTAGALLALRFYPDREESSSAAGRLGWIAVTVILVLAIVTSPGRSIRLRVPACARLNFMQLRLADVLDLWSRFLVLIFVMLNHRIK